MVDGTAPHRPAPHIRQANLQSRPFLRSFQTQQEECIEEWHTRPYYTIPDENMTVMGPPGCLHLLPLNGGDLQVERSSFPEHHRDLVDGIVAQTSAVMDPIHITEFASERYFSKLRQLNGSTENSTAAAGSSTATSTILEPPLEGPTFTLPIGNPRQRHSSEALVLRPSEQRKRSLGHDLTSLRTQRRPSFSGSFGSLRSRVTIKTPSIAERQEDVIVEEQIARPSVTLGHLFLALPNELQAQIISPLSIHTILNLRLVSKSFHNLVALNESPIARYHVVHSLPSYTLRLFPSPEPTQITLHYICSIWHRLHVAMKLSAMIAAQATKEIFLRTSPAQQLEFETQHRRMRQRLVPLVFTIFHFFEKYRDLHVKHLAEHGVPLSRQPFTLHPIESQVMAMYDDQTLLRVHQVFPLVISSFSRRLRPPSYAGRIERSIKGYLKERPADEVYATILAIGGLRQAQRFWETKGYNARRASVDAWYGFVTRSPVEPAPKSKISRIANIGRKKNPSVVDVGGLEAGAGHELISCNEWFCVKPTCLAARKQRLKDDLILQTSLSAGPPMGPLSQDQLQLILPDLQPLTSIWLVTAEALILQRKIVERAQDIKRNHQVLLDLIRDNGDDRIDDWSPGNATDPNHIVHTYSQEGMGSSWGVSD
ncbi:hypothetical protein B7494_g8095 [Chlorociboria aeruginascens]|nr:hypothetical protein B7494_g8095 [Chlorociboria aeruginascens]